MNEASSDTLTNGPGAAALLSAAIGCFTLGVLALLGDAFAGVAGMLNLWKPTGALSGVTDAAILVWLILWFALSYRWKQKTVNLARIGWASLALFTVGALLTFPPFMDLLQGK